MSPLAWLLNDANLTPHGFCLAWDPAILWLDAAGDAVTALAYFSIPIAVLQFINRRRDLPHRWMAILFAAFIIACGSTHILGLVTLWVPAYKVELVAKLVTALLSIVTAAALWPIIPKLLALPSPQHLNTLNAELERSQAALREQNRVLDERVNERTRELNGLNATIGRSEMRFRKVVEAAPNAMIMVDASGLIELVNAQAEQTFGFNRKELIGAPIELLIPVRFHARHPELRRSFFGEAQARPMGAQSVLYGLRRNGAEFEVEVGLNPIETDDGPRVLASVTDISERVRAAAELEDARNRAERANMAKSRFLASISHELRTPLNGILGYAQLLQMEGDLNVQQRERVGAMLSAGHHLLSTINGVLDLSEIEAEQLKLTVAPFDLAAVLSDCVAILRPKATEKGLRLEALFAPGLPGRVMGDRVRLQQILVNLLGNAIKFTARGGVELHAEALKGKDLLRFTVADTGPGIPDDQIERIFRKFERLDEHVTGAVEGSGLGLSISSHLARLMGGSLQYQVRAQGGSSFYVDVPLLPCAAPERLPAADLPVDAARTPTRPARVLVVDDVAMNRDIVKAFLNVAGHHVTMAAGGAEAVGAAATEDFDVILMDVRMPDVDGLEATRRIRALGGPRGSVPIIGLTAQAFVQQIAECRAAGMDGHLSKPFTAENLLRDVQQAAAFGRRRALAAQGAHAAAPGPALATSVLLDKIG